jgi:hypothetical protein
MRLKTSAIAPISQTTWIRNALILTLWLAFGLRLFRLGGESLWYDETVSVYLAQQPLQAMLAHTASDIHPPGYYLLLHGWRWLSQPALTHGFEFLYAWPSAFCGVLLLALLFALGRRLYNAAIALFGVWLAAVNPFQLWYSQEVRMYTLGACLGLLCLWVTLKFFTAPSGHSARRSPTRNVLLYAIYYSIIAAIGLYTLYYFLFVLLALNLLALFLWLPRPRRRNLAWSWLGAQLSVLVLYLPWLPVFYRQAIDPPVPGWRLPWQTFGQIWQALLESLSALLLGQSQPGPQWLWALGAAVLLVVFGFNQGVDSKTHESKGRAKAALLIYLLTPATAIYLVTLLVTPLYHVRYLFTYAAPMMLVVAAALTQSKRVHRLLPLLLCALFTGASFAGLYEFWRNPLYGADDHRAAVAELAAAWRPGDVILVNAGWSYTALGIYWPNAHNQPAPSADTIAVEPIERVERLTDYTNGNADLAIGDPSGDSIRLVRSGSVEGQHTLGWGDPESDFYAINAADTLAALHTLATRYRRIWHYRIYDTVNDPSGQIRTALGQNGRLVWEKAYPGRDYLRVQLFESNLANAGNPQHTVQRRFGERVELLGHTTPAQVVAGRWLYSTLYLQALSGAGSLDALSLSLRLYAQEGKGTPAEQLVSQFDAAPYLPSTGWLPGRQQVVPLALPVAPTTPPARYSLELVIYRQSDSTPLTLTEAEDVIYGQRLQLQIVEILPMMESGGVEN